MHNDKICSLLSVCNNQTAILNSVATVRIINTQHVHCVSKKTILVLHAITSTHINRLTIFGSDVADLVHYRAWFVIPPILTNVSEETCTPEISFSVMLYTMSRK